MRPVAAQAFVVSVLLLTGCSSVPPPNPIPVTRADSPVEVYYRSAAEIKLTGRRDSTLHFSEVNLVTGRLIERRGDSALVAVTLVDDAADEVVQVPEGFVLRVEHGDSVVLRKPLGDQQMADLGMILVVLALFVAAVHAVGTPGN